MAHALIRSMIRTGSIFPGPGPGGVESREGSGGSFQESINMFDEEEEDDEKNAINGADCCTFWPWFLADRPILRLFLVMGLNGLVSMGVAAIFIELESPAQKERCDNYNGYGLHTFMFYPLEEHSELVFLLLCSNSAYSGISDKCVVLTLSTLH